VIGEDRNTQTLSVADLRKVYPDGTRALDGVSFVANPGEVTAILGANGSGKSTLLRCALGLEKATSGTVRVGGEEITALKGGRLRALRRRIGAVFQKFHLVGNVSVFQNVLHGSMGESSNPLRWWAATAPDASRRKALACLERVDLVHLASRRAGTLSGGQQQRVAIARMLMQEPELVLADEPVASLDPRAGRDLMTLLVDVARERGLTVICTLHQLDLAAEHADRVVGLRDGRVVLDGSADRVGRERLDLLYRARIAAPEDPAPNALRVGLDE
jgi:phosphonate transport system ATP-binding protein